MEKVNVYAEQGKTKLNEFSASIKKELNMVVGKAKELGVPDLAPTLTPLGEKIGVTFESTLILAAAAIAAVGLLFLWITGLLKSLIPAASICWYMYKSIKALEEGEQAVTVYLMYWVVLYFLIIVEQTPFGLILKTVPFYPLLRLAGLSMVGIPQTGAALNLFETLTGKTACTSEGPETSSPKTAGTLLTVKIISAGPFPSDSPPDAFVTLTVVPRGGKANEGVEGLQFKTRVCKGSAQPEWNETIKMRPLASLDADLVVTVLGHKQIGHSNDKLGECKTSLADLEMDGESEKLDLQMDGAVGSTLSLELGISGASTI
eukprot:CAMPEP_0119476812 /NCGR_PEP_ID=MMETSP1344-20130328/7190_1 /TAXON_ID=236787 /ORGANISM="Florenciella parvula, Strain CCMP2471" /LENGTH=317 /DNA_ID=CAMNT_0007510669 /DNA_START=31 /DNA_END=984 /DNA_ORIENTATION=+